MRSEEAGELFYKKLFEVEPGLQSIFKNDMAFQGKKLIRMLTAIITRIQKIEDIMPEIDALSQRHVNYGTKPEHYALVGKALIRTLEQCLGNRWTEETSQAWQTVYGVVAQTMIQAAGQETQTKSIALKPE